MEPKYNYFFFTTNYRRIVNKNLQLDRTKSSDTFILDSKHKYNLKLIQPGTFIKWYIL